MAEHLLRYMFNETHMMDVIGLNCTVWMAAGSKIFRLKSTGRHIALINLKKQKQTTILRHMGFVTLARQYVSF